MEVQRTTIDVGAIIAGVRIDELVARTGANLVYRGTHVESGDQKAVKLLKHPDAAAARRLQREARLLNQVNHDALVPLYALVATKAGLALITDWVQGCSLRERLADGSSFSVEETLALAQQLADGLDHLHAHDIVHRDVSPANIIVGPGGAPVLIDLGIGHSIEEATMTNHDLVAGVPRYLAPEMIRGEQATGRSDQYSLAVLTYELLAGRSPFPDGQNLSTLLHHQVFTEPAPLDELVPSTPSHITRALQRALAKDPRQRFDSALDFAAALRGEEHDVGLVGVATKGSIGPARVALLLLMVIPLLIVAVLARRQIGPTEVLGSTETPAATSTASAPANEPAAAWPAGTAAALTCNLLVGSDFETGSVPVDYFGDPPARERVVAQGGYGDTWALEVGLANNFGQFGEIVPVVGGEEYVFSSWLQTVGTVAEAEMGISLLDAGYQPLDATVSIQVDTQVGEFAQVRFSDLPSSAAFAIPYLFKDSSPGVLIADELVFGTTAACGPDLRRTEPS